LGELRDRFDLPGELLGWRLHLAAPLQSLERTLPLAVFENGAHRTLTDVFATYNERGAQYKDSWALENQPPGFVDAMRELVGDDHSNKASRIIRLAGLADTKISRIISGGAYRRDSYVDLIAYLSLLCELHEQYAAEPSGEQVPGAGEQSTAEPGGSSRCVA
jgi:hypothetical protein